MRKFIRDRRSYLKGRKPRRASSATKLFNDLQIIIQADERKAMLYWQIGKLIRDEFRLLKDRDRREKLLASLAKKLAEEYDNGFTKKTLKQMIQFCTLFSDARTASLLAQDLTWDHFVALIPIRNPMKRNFYAELSRMEGWTPDELNEQIENMMFEKAAMNTTSSTDKAIQLFSALRGDESSPLDKFIYDDSSPLDDL